MSAADVHEDAVDLAEPDFLYELKRPIGIWPAVYIIGAIALLGVTAVMFLIGLLLPPEAQAFPVFIVTTVAPALGAIALFGAALGLLRSPHRVTVGAQELVVEGDRGVRRWTWDQIGWAAVGVGGMGFQKQLSIFDPTGKKLVTLGTAFEDFDGLVETIKAAIDRKSDDTAEKVQSRKAKKVGTFMILGGLAFVALAIANGAMARTEKIAAARLAEDGVEAEATIKRHYLYNVTPRIEYAFTTPDGKAVTRDTMMRQAAWNELDGAETVPVRYVPGDPDNNRLVAGEVDDEPASPQLMEFVSVGVGVMALFFIGVGVMQWSGWDIDLDSKTGKLSIKRFGTGR